MKNKIGFSELMAVINNIDDNNPESYPVIFKDNEGVVTSIVGFDEHNRFVWKTDDNNIELDMSYELWESIDSEIMTKIFENYICTHNKENVFVLLVNSFNGELIK